MYKCWNCNKEFDEPEIEKTSYEDLYGIDDGLSRNPIDLEVCPYCKSDQVFEIEEPEQEAYICHECKYFYEIDDCHGACTLVKPYTVVSAGDDACEKIEVKDDRV